MENTMLPQNLIVAIGSESKDFAVKAEHAQPLKKSFSLIMFGTVWTAFSSIFVFIFLMPVFQGKEIQLESNGVPVVAGPYNLGPMVMPAIIIGFFVVAGIGMLGSGIYSIFKKGGYFVGTQTRLVHYRNGNIRSIDWEQFTGDIEVNGDAQKGNISLQMRTGRLVSRKNSPARFVPDIIYISGIPGVFEIEQVCRKRIKENDPTPPATEHDFS